MDFRPEFFKATEYDVIVEVLEKGELIKMKGSI